MLSYEQISPPNFTEVAKYFMLLDAKNKKKPATPEFLQIKFSKKKISLMETPSELLETLEILANPKLLNEIKSRRSRAKKGTGVPWAKIKATL